jgi:hypothetical protein
MVSMVHSRHLTAEVWLSGGPALQVSPRVHIRICVLQQLERRRCADWGLDSTAHGAARCAPWGVALPVLRALSSPWLWRTSSARSRRPWCRHRAWARGTLAVRTAPTANSTRTRRGEPRIGSRSVVADRRAASDRVASVRVVLAKGRERWRTSPDLRPPDAQSARWRLRGDGDLLQQVVSVVEKLSQPSRFRPLLPAR